MWGKQNDKSFTAAINNEIESDKFEKEMGQYLLPASEKLLEFLCNSIGKIRL